ncbi:hypothetical protein EV44_g3320 [Erysiphe necator]|uniref:Uncharacterized protein n=1 Tax=Uncinula necator TaxID=52586 RepID=A0A0B1NY82_UNCNE|nr:hypothetical protein EV44_g3320 [Erysiphe necator]
MPNPRRTYPTGGNVDQGPDPTGNAFINMFANGKDQVDFTDHRQFNAPLLPLPTADDDMHTIKRKFMDFAMVVNSGKSVAIRTGYRAPAQEKRDPVQVAKQSMTPDEIMQYDAWAAGIMPPTFNWEVDRKPVAGGAGAQARFEKRARAARRIWGNNAIVPENISWIAANHNYILPLVIAMAKIVAIGMDNINRQQELIKCALRDITYAKDTLQARMNAIKGLIKGSKGYDDPVNRKKLVAGLAPIGSQLDFQKAGSGVRIERTDLLGNVGLKQDGSKRSGGAAGPSNTLPAPNKVIVTRRKVMLGRELECQNSNRLTGI